MLSDITSATHLLEDDYLSAYPRVGIGETCVVRANSKAQLFTGKPVFWCCIMWGFEYLDLNDGSIVEVVDFDPTDPSIVTVRVLRTVGHPIIDNLIGTVKAIWLEREHKEEARVDHMTFEHYHHQHQVSSSSSSSQKQQNFMSLGRIEENMEDNLIINNDNVKVENNFNDNNNNNNNKEQSMNITLTDESIKNKHYNKKKYPKDTNHNNIAHEIGDRIKHILHIEDSSPYGTPRKPNIHDQAAIVRSQQTSPHISPFQTSKQNVIQPPPLNINDEQQILSNDERSMEISFESDTIESLAGANESKRLLVSTEFSKLPSGTLRYKHLQILRPLFTHGIVNYPDFIPILLDNKPRILPGSVFQRIAGEVNDPRFSKLAFLRPIIDCMIELESDGKGNITIRLRFKGRVMTIQSPPMPRLVLSSGLEHDPYLVHPDNKVLESVAEARTFIFKDTMNVTIDKDGVVGFNDNDIQIKAVFKFNASLRTVHHFGRIEYDNKQQPLLKVDANEQPIIIDNHYVPQVFDDWLVITVLGQENWLGLPPLCPKK